jgi:hypothetical protein
VQKKKLTGPENTNPPIKARSSRCRPTPKSGLLFTKRCNMTHHETNPSLTGRSLAVGFALTVTILLAQPAAGQNTPRSPSAPLKIDPPACLDQERLRPEDGNARQPDESTPNLSEKLERSEGVICPPARVDPEIDVVPPAGGRTPVIPPPGSPGGDPNVRPK